MPPMMLPPPNARMLRAAQVLNMQRAQAAQAAQAQARGGFQGRPQGPPRGVQMGPVTQQRAQQAALKQSGGTDWQAAVDATRQAHGQKAPGGGGGVGGLLSKAFHVATAPLQLLDVPRRAVISTAQELGDALGGRGFSGEDWVKQVKDPNFGVGTVLGDATGNKWLDRIIGFAGDVALDPLTYLTLGASEVPGAAGRAALVRTGEAAGLPEEILNKVGRYGGNAVRDADTRVALGLKPKIGMEFGGIHIPGSETVTRALQKGVNVAKEPFLDSGLGKQVRKWGVSRDPELRAAFERLVTGKGEEGVGQAARHITGEQGKRAASDVTEAIYGREAVQIGDVLGDNAAHTHAWEAGDLSHPEVQRAADLTNELHAYQAGDAARNIEGKGVSVGKFEPPASNPNMQRVPHVLTENGEEVFGKAKPGGAGGVSDGPQGAQFGRQIKPGVDKAGNPRVYKIGGHEFTPQTGSIQEINEWAESVGLGKLYEDSPKYLTALMVEQAGGAVGEARYWQELAAPGRYKQAYGTTDNWASKEAVDNKASKLLGAERAKKVDAYRNDVLWKRSRAEGQATEVFKQLKEQWVATTKADFDKAKGLDREAQTELNASLKAAEKLGTPQEAHALVTAKAEELAARSQKKLEAAKANLDRAEARLAEFNTTSEGRVSAARAAAEKERDRVLGKYQEAVDTARRRDIVRKRLGRAEVKQAGLDESQAALEALAPKAVKGKAQATYDWLPEELRGTKGALSDQQRVAALAAHAEEGPPTWLPGVEESRASVTEEVPVAQAAPTVEQPRAPKAPKPVAGGPGPDDVTLPNGRFLSGKYADEWNTAKSEFDNWSAHVQGAIAEGAKQNDPFLKEAVQKAKRAKATMQMMEDRAKLVPEGWVPPGAAVPEVAPVAETVAPAPPQTHTVTTPVIEGGQTSPLEQQIAAVAKSKPKVEARPVPEVGAELAGARTAAAEGQGLVKGLQKEKGKLDTKFGRQAEGRAIKPDAVEAKAVERVRAVEEPIAGQRDQIVQRVTKHREGVQKFTDEGIALNTKLKGDLDAIMPMFDAADQRIIDAANAKTLTEAGVKDARAPLADARKMSTTPGSGQSWEELASEARTRHTPTDPITGQPAPANLDPKTKKLLDAADGVVKSMSKHDTDANMMYKFAKDLKTGKLTEQMVRVAKDGYQLESLDRKIGKDLYVRTEMMRMKNNFVRQAKKEPGAIGRAIDTYTKFFKAWATATPGFHIRNAMSATYMNMTEGVAGREMMDGVKIWQAFRKNPMERLEDGTFAWVSTLPEHLQGNAEQVVEAVYHSGAGGRFSAAELSGRAFGERNKGRGSKLYENRWTTKSKNIGERVEGGVRAGLALHSLGKGEGMPTAIARIKRVHFDYSDVNETDEALRRIVPFWTFMSRNLPVQVQQMWTKPRTYAHYNSLTRNFTDDADAWMPEWMKGEGTFNIAKGLGLAPDIGATQIQEQLDMLKDPKRLLSNVNPIIKTPLELATNQDFFYGSTYKKNDFQKMGADTRWMAPFMQALGLAAETGSGPVMERKHMNAIYDLIPFLGQANRLGSTTPNREGKGLQSALNFAGVPIRLIDPEGQRKDILNQRIRNKYQSPDEARMEALRQFG